MSYTWPASLSLYCPADAQIQQRGLFVIGSPTVVAAAMVGHGIARRRGLRRAQRMAEPQWRKAGNGYVTLDEVGIKVVAPGAFEDVFVAYRTITSWTPTRTGVELQRAGWAPLRIDTPDPKSLQDWLAHLSHGKTWTAPVLTTCAPQLQLLSWCQQDQRFTFAITEGWFVADWGWLNWLGEDDPGQIVAGVRRERPGYEPNTALSLIVSEIPPNPELNPQTIEHNADDVAAAMAMFSGSSFEHPIELVNLDGERATMFRLTRYPPDSIDQTHIFVTRHGQLFDIRFVISPAPVNDYAYSQSQPELHTMLATWHWYW